MQSAGKSGVVNGGWLLTMMIGKIMIKNTVKGMPTTALSRG
jgi:hypothetical protein